MSKENIIDTAFRRLRAEGKKAFIPFVTAGDPNIEATALIVREMIRNGADLVEIGVPYSDPSMDGPVIMRADRRALESGTRLRDIFRVVRELSADFPEIPFLLLLYFNSVFVYGIERFFSEAEEAGISGLIIPDLPIEERAEAQPAASAHGIYLISMVAPTSLERAERICKEAEGFLYCVTSLGVTGVRKEYQTSFQEYFERLDSFSNIPKCAGFGISDPEQKRQIEQYCDGTIVGSAVERKIEAGIEQGLDEARIARSVGNLVFEFTGGK
ncbi:MAG: tryptophan synthase subunit alpha [Clostridiaceae bacterium]|nr:tryptophan synthase subunit alpha [Oscillospiraceae bacterium]NLO62154.1 tryptophan synthase subunit alpha [Clostridiaceae bacterium]